MLLPNDHIIHFRQLVYNFYAQHGRSFEWRMNYDPYRVVVSEIMLQQTQTSRVETKFHDFIATFSSFEELAQARLCDVLGAWQGLGYNRRAQALYQIAQRVMQEYGGVLPASVELLQTFPGIGQATASSICAFAFNMPTVFIETNIRAVFIHTFFTSATTPVEDKTLLPLVTQTLDHTHARQWYYALMDYGVYLKKIYKNPARKSAHYTKQSRFQGSDRQIRGAIIRHLVTKGPIARQDLLMLLNDDTSRVERIIDQLIAEKMIRSDDQHVIMI